MQFLRPHYDSHFVTNLKASPFIAHSVVVLMEALCRSYGHSCHHVPVDDNLQRGKAAQRHSSLRPRCPQNLRRLDRSTECPQPILLPSWYTYIWDALTQVEDQIRHVGALRTRGAL